MVILVAEDDVHVQFLAWKLLKAAGFTVLKADNGEAALELSRNHPGIIRSVACGRGDATYERPGALQDHCGTPGDETAHDVE
jgi:CheY-like chemotaxis protein